MNRSANSPALDGTQHRILFYCANGGAMFQGMARIIEAHIAHSHVELTDHPPGTVPKEDVNLLLLYGVCRRDKVDTIATWRQDYPNAALGLVVESIGEENALLGHLFNDYIVQGILPLDYELDVWLAAISVLLSGGKFYPFNSRHAHVFEGRHYPGRPMEPGLKIEHDQMARPDRTLGLTPRERDILRLISEGHQNKVIASRMGLSEHTVKVHVHNLIAKLRVTNRTQAAIAFLASDGVPAAS